MINTLPMRKIILYCSFVITGLVVITGFITATSYTQLAVAILLYPLLIYFTFKTFPRKTYIDPLKKQVTSIIQTSSVKPVAEIAEETKKENTIGISDINKRAFLKLIGATGFSFFLISIFGRKIESLLFNGQNLLQKPASIGTPQETKADISKTSPTDGYNISEVDDNVISYYGFINKEGHWFIMKGDTDNGTFRYVRGKLDFPGNWKRRQGLDYDYFYQVFP